MVQVSEGPKRVKSMDTFLSFLEKLIDQVNLGRAIIYTGAGLLFVLPIFMVFEALFCPGSGACLGQKVINDLKVPFKRLDLLLIASYVFGLLVVTGSYPIIDAIQRRYRPDEGTNAKVMGTKEREPLNVNYHFKALARKGDTATREPLGWLITEYFRFIEAATYLPVGILGFFAIFSFYFAAQIPSYGIEAFIYGCVSMLLFLCLYLFYCCFWLRKVVAPAVRVFQNAKYSLISGLTTKNTLTGTEYGETNDKQKR